MSVRKRGVAHRHLCIPLHPFLCFVLAEAVQRAVKLSAANGMEQMKVSVWKQEVRMDAGVHSLCTYQIAVSQISEHDSSISLSSGQKQQFLSPVLCHSMP